MSTMRLSAVMISIVTREQDHGVGGGGRELQRVEPGLDDLAGGRDLLAAHDAEGDEIAHHDGDDEDRADDDAGLCSAG